MPKNLPITAFPPVPTNVHESPNLYRLTLLVQACNFRPLGWLFFISIIFIYGHKFWHKCSPALNISHYWATVRATPEKKLKKIKTNLIQVRILNSIVWLVRILWTLSVFTIKVMLWIVVSRNDTRMNNVWCKYSWDDRYFLRVVLGT